MKEIQRFLIGRGSSNSLKESKEYDELLYTIQDKVDHYLVKNPELLFSHLYRLDIDEILVEKVLTSKSEISPSLSLAKLILDREILRHSTKKNLLQNPIKGWEW